MFHGPPSSGPNLTDGGRSKTSPKADVGFGVQGDGHIPRDGTWSSYAAVGAVGVLPYLELVAANPDENPDLGRLAVYATVTAVVLVGASWLVGRGRPDRTRRAAVILAVLAWLFFHVPTVDALWLAVDLHGPTHVRWLILTAVVLAALTPASGSAAFQRWLVVVAPAVLLVPVISIAAGGWTPAVAGIATATPVRGITVTRPANVYVFLVDGYARADVIADHTGLSILPFHDDLIARGFVVSEDAVANYPTSFLSIASTMSMTYLEEDGEHDELAPYYDIIRGNSVVRRTFDELGYAYVHAHSGVWDGAYCPADADRCLGGSGSISEVEWALLQRTPFGASVARRTIIPRLAVDTDPSQIVSRLYDGRHADPVLLFAHLLSPHPPFTRESDCALRSGFSYAQASWGNPDGYAGQITCLNQQLLAATDRILAEDPDPVIVIQSDHGTEFAFEPDQRLPILSAMRLPQGCDGAVPDDLTPVNTFRIVLNCLTTSDLELLPNRYFWVEYGKPQVTEIHP